MIHKVCLPSTTISSTLLAEALRTVFSFENDEDDYVLFTFSDDVEVSDTNLQRMSTILAEGDYDAVYYDEPNVVLISRELVENTKKSYYSLEETMNEYIKKGFECDADDSIRSE